MTTIADTITDALRMTGDLDKNEVAEGPQLDDALPVFQSMLEGWVYSGLFGKVDDVLVATDCTAGEFQRILAEVAVEVTLPATIPLWPGCTDARPPQDGAIVILAMGSPHQVYRYDGQGATWVSFTDLSLTDTAPLASYGTAGLASCLAEVLATTPQRIANMGAAYALTASRAAAFRAALARRGPAWKPVECDDLAVLRMSVQANSGWMC